MTRKNRNPLNFEFLMAAHIVLLSIQILFQRHARLPTEFNANFVENHKYLKCVYE